MTGRSHLPLKLHADNGIKGNVAGRMLDLARERLGTFGNGQANNRAVLHYGPPLLAHHTNQLFPIVADRDSSLNNYGNCFWFAS